MHHRKTPSAAPSKSGSERELIQTSGIAARRLSRIFEKENIYVSSVPLSVIPFMFLRKAFHVHEAVMTLCKAGMASEAYALSRIMVEMFIVLRWITNRDQNDRAKEYAFFVAKRKEYWAKTLQRYYPNSLQSAEAQKHVDKLYSQYAAKYKSSIFWTREKLKGMAEEPEELDTAPTAPKTALWEYEIPYSMTSDHVHATVAAIDDLVPLPGTAYDVSRIANPRLVESAAFTATAWLFRIAARVDIARNLSLAPAITNALQPFEALATGKAGSPALRVRTARAATGR
jgi:hypothetical protein